MIFHPFVQLIKFAAAVACVEVRLHANGGVGQDLNKHRGSVAVAHDGLAQLLDAVVDVHALSHGRRVQRRRHVVPLVIITPRVLPQVVEAVQLVEHHDACGITPALLFRELLELLGLTPRVELLDLVLFDADLAHCSVGMSWLKRLQRDKVLHRSQRLTLPHLCPCLFQLLCRGTAKLGLMCELVVKVEVLILNRLVQRSCIEHFCQPSLRISPKERSELAAELALQ